MAALAMKRQHDKSHQPMLFHPGDKVLLRLHKGYDIPKALSAKYSDQYAGPFDIVQRVGPLAYKLDIPDTWRIHPVISIAHLEAYPEFHQAVGHLNGGSVDLLRNNSDNHFLPSSLQQANWGTAIYHFHIPSYHFLSQHEHLTRKGFLQNVEGSAPDYEGTVTGVWDLLLKHYFNESDGFVYRTPDKVEGGYVDMNSY
ncbi:hypothetical protein GB937_007183 [Aspergillus fischeri]|nr:hypothetical protein GB937_007183 [Aspergillus fischeri]